MDGWNTCVTVCARACARVGCNGGHLVWMDRDRQVGWVWSWPCTSNQQSSYATLQWPNRAVGLNWWTSLTKLGVHEARVCAHTVLSLSLLHPSIHSLQSVSQSVMRSISRTARQGSLTHVKMAGGEASAPHRSIKTTPINTARICAPLRGGRQADRHQDGPRKSHKRKEKEGHGSDVMGCDVM